jgi:mRNA-degrading endonuclease RelE of RelBE toxin-antitoxin system
VYGIRFAEDVEKDLAKIPVYYRKQILDAIERQLAHTPDTPTRNRKFLSNLIPPWEAVQPVWELRVGDYRIFYDVSNEEAIVYVRAVRKKPPGRKTEDIL